MFSLLKIFRLQSPFLSRGLYVFLFSLLGLVYIIGLFVPLMDNDSAHHANIALRMYLTGDYVNLVDNGTDYLDKPHLHFWLCALSYKLFGVNSFAYKFPSLLFSIAGVYSTYRLGKILYSKEVGKLSALLVASAFAYILANHDVRMDAILTACVAFSMWQLVEFIHKKTAPPLLGAAFGLALGFCTKGMIAVFVPGIAAFFYILYRKEWKLFLSPGWLFLLLLFGLLISPVLYCYYQQFNLHPEKIVRGNDHINGVRFILIDQSIERFLGKMGPGRGDDYFFFLHSFLWAFAPWSLLGYIALGERLKNFPARREEWLTPSVFVVMLLVISFSGFKLPHYLNLVFPATAVLVSSLIAGKSDKNDTRIRLLFILQLSVAFLLLLLAVFVNGWSFPLGNGWLIAGVVLLLSVVFYFLRSPRYNKQQKAVLVPVAAIVLIFFLLNGSFYPQLLTYQGGNQLATASRGIVNPADVYCWKDTRSSSFVFYTSSLSKQFDDSVLSNANRNPVWLLYDIRDEGQIRSAGYHLGRRFESRDYEISRLDLKFFIPSKREALCSKLVLAELSGAPE